MQLGGGVVTVLCEPMSPGVVMLAVIDSLLSSLHCSSQRREQVAEKVKFFLSSFQTPKSHDFVYFEFNFKLKDLRSHCVSIVLFPPTTG